MLFPLSACSGSDARNAIGSESEISPAAVYIAHDPQQAVDKIYAEIDIRDITPLDDATLRDLLGFNLDEIEEYYGRYSSGRYGIADVYIIRPNEECFDSVRERLEQVRYSRISFTENYDILDSNKIAQNSKIFRYGSYLVLLMVEDLERAELLIEQYIPSTELGE